METIGFSVSAVQTGPFIPLHASTRGKLPVWGYPAGGIQRTAADDAA
jgi:hypothetical protein